MVRFHGGAQLILGERVDIFKGCSIVASCGGKIEIGDDFVVNMYSLIYCNKQITIGNHVRGGWRIQICDSSVHYMVNISDGNVKPSINSVEIGDNVWLANHVAVAPGAKVPPFTIVASHSLVGKDYTVDSKIGGFLAGVPAKYRESGKVRLLNEAIEWRLKSQIFNNADCIGVDIRQLGYNVEPFDGKVNILYRSE